MRAYRLGEAAALERGSRLQTPDPQLPPLASPCLGILRPYTTTCPERSPVLPRVGGLEPQRLPGVGSWCLRHRPVSF